MRKITEEVAAVVREWQCGEISCEEMIRILTGKVLDKSESLATEIADGICDMPLMDGRTDVQLPGDIARMKEMIVYISAKCQDDPTFGAIKLNKILFLADFRAYRLRGKPITGTAYFRLKLGPAPKAMLPVLEELHRDDAVKTQRRLVAGMEQKRPIALRRPDLKYFDAEDIAIVDGIIEDLWGRSATTVSAESHGIQWQTRFDKDPIPYEAAYLSDEPVTADDIDRARELIRDLDIVTH